MKVDTVLTLLVPCTGLTSDLYSSTLPQGYIYKPFCTLPRKEPDTTRPKLHALLLHIISHRASPLTLPRDPIILHLTWQHWNATSPHCRHTPCISVTGRPHRGQCSAPPPLCPLLPPPLPPLPPPEPCGSSPRERSGWNSAKWTMMFEQVRGSGRSSWTDALSRGTCVRVVITERYEKTSADCMGCDDNLGTMKGRVGRCFCTKVSILSWHLRCAERVLDMKALENHLSDD